MHTAIIGPMHSGKTTLAKALVAKHGYTRMALADPVKQAAVDMCNLFIDEYYWQLPDQHPIDLEEIEANKAVFRPFLQWLGTEFGRQYCGNDRLWINAFATRVKNHGWNGPIVCDDVRFPNEAEALRGLGFRIVRIRRPEEDRLASCGGSVANVSAVSGHSSESQIDLIPTDIDRTCHTLADVEAFADQLAVSGKLGYAA